MGDSEQDSTCDSITTSSDFPSDQLNSLEEKLKDSRWSETIRPGKELPSLMDACINLCEEGEVDEKNENLQQFLRDTLPSAFTKMLTDDDVGNWDPEMHNHVKKNCEKFLKLQVNMAKSVLNLLPVNMLAMVFDRKIKFHVVNASRSPEFVPKANYAFPLADDSENPHGWLVDLINSFFEVGDGNHLHETLKTIHISTLKNCNELILTLSDLSGVLRPLERCCTLLNAQIIESWSSEIVNEARQMIDNLTTDEHLLNEVEFAEAAEKKSIFELVSDIINAINRINPCMPQEEKIVMNSNFIQAVNHVIN